MVAQDSVVRRDYGFQAPSIEQLEKSSEIPRYSSLEIEKLLQRLIASDGSETKTGPTVKCQSGDEGSLMTRDVTDSPFLQHGRQSDSKNSDGNCADKRVVVRRSKSATSKNEEYCPRSKTASDTRRVVYHNRTGTKTHRKPVFVNEFTVRQKPECRSGCMKRFADRHNPNYYDDRQLQLSRATANETYDHSYLDGNKLKQRTNYYADPGQMVMSENFHWTARGDLIQDRQHYNADRHHALDRRDESKYFISVNSFWNKQNNKAQSLKMVAGNLWSQSHCVPFYKRKDAVQSGSQRQWNGKSKNENVVVHLLNRVHAQLVEYMQLVEDKSERSNGNANVGYNSGNTTYSATASQCGHYLPPGTVWKGSDGTNVERRCNRFLQPTHFMARYCNGYSYYSDWRDNTSSNNAESNKPRLELQEDQHARYW